MSTDKVSNEEPSQPSLLGAVISRFSLWWIRTFKVISNQRAKELGLRHWRNVYGDEINHTDCRSIWVDDKSRQYYVSHLEDVS